MTVAGLAAASSRRWEALWYPSVSLRRLAAFRFLITAYAFYDVAASGYVARMAGADHIFYTPIFFARIARLPAPTPALMDVIRPMLLVALAFAALGFLTRLALAVAGPLYLWWWAIDSSYGKINHGHVVAAVAVFALALAPSGRAYSIDALARRGRSARAGEPLPDGGDAAHPLAGWALRVVMLLLVSAYVGAAFAKLDRGGLGWVSDGAFHAALLEKATPLGLEIAKHVWLTQVLGATAVLLEASAWMLFLRGRARDLWCVGGLVFHVTSLFLLDVDFLGQVVAYAAFYDLEAGAARAHVYVSRLAGRLGPPLAVMYDEARPGPVRIVAILDGLDWFGQLRPVAAGSLQANAAALSADDGTGGVDGYAALRRAARRLPALWPAFALASIPGLRRVGEIVYDRLTRSDSGSGTFLASTASGGTL